MAEFVEKIMARIWNGIVTRKARDPNDRYENKLDFGLVIKDGQLTNYRFGLNQGRRAEHIAILGKTGSGKSYFLRHLASQDVGSNHGFVYFDLHGDATPFLLHLLAAREQREQVDLSEKVIVIEPADPLYSVGLNVLETKDTRHSFVQIA